MIYHHIMIHLVILVLFVGLSASNTRLAMHDEISAPLRKKLFVKYGEQHFINRMLDCERCTAFWATMPVTVLILAGYTWFMPQMWWMYLIAFIPVNKAVAYYGFLLLRRE
jgi:hypothetical protein